MGGKSRNLKPFLRPIVQTGTSVAKRPGNGIVRRSMPMTSLRMTQIAAAGATLAALAFALPAAAQSASSAANYQAGYGNARYATAQNPTGSTRDANGNRLIVDGIIQAGASAYSSASPAASPPPIPARVGRPAARPSAARPPSATI